MSIGPDKFLIACQKGNSGIVTSYLNEGGDANVRDEYQLTGLILAGRGGHVSVAKLLIKAGANLEIGDIRGRTALFHAATFKRYEFVELLAKSGANVNPVDSHGCTPLDISRMSNHTKMAQLLQKLGGMGKSDNGATSEPLLSQNASEIERQKVNQTASEPKFQLVLQFPGTTEQDFDVLLNLEESLADALDGTPHEVDGHDFGSGTGNIFIHTNDPIGAFDLAKKMVNLPEHPTLKAAYRSFEEDDFTLIWPENSQEEFNIM